MGKDAGKLAEATFQSGDARLWYGTLAAGEGLVQGGVQDLVLLHPTPVHHEFWLPVARVMSGPFRVILPDLRGHGRSEAGAGVITVPKLAADIERMLDTAGIGRAVFAGCSIGSYTLYELWRRAPERVAGLAFVCGKPQADTAAGREKRRETIAQVRREGTAGFFDAMRDTLVGATCRRLHPERADSARAMMERTSAEAVMAVQQGLADRADQVEMLASITVPVLAVAGAEDSGSTPPEMQVIAERVPGARFRVLDQTGHYAPWEQPELVGGLLVEWVRDSRF